MRKEPTPSRSADRVFVRDPADKETPAPSLIHVTEPGLTVIGVSVGISSGPFTFTKRRPCSPAGTCAFESTFIIGITVLGKTHAPAGQSDFSRVTRIICQRVG